jgi:hypothetical protein
MPKPQSNKQGGNENLPTITKLRITLSRAAWEGQGEGNQTDSISQLERMEVLWRSE